MIASRWESARGCCWIIDALATEETIKAGRSLIMTDDYVLECEFVSVVKHRAP
jgi:hypothetical protein